MLHIAKVSTTLYDHVLIMYLIAISYLTVDIVLLCKHFHSVKKAYHLLILKIHPDRVEKIKREAAAEQFIVLKLIYNVLNNPRQKRQYDEEGTVSIEPDQKTAIQVTEFHKQHCKDQYAGMRTVYYYLLLLAFE